MIQPSLRQVKESADRGNVIPVCKDIMGDLLTPAAAFLRLAHGRSRAFLLESVEGGERLARYSFIGWDPFLTVRGRDGEVSAERQGEVVRERSRGLEKLREIGRTFPRSWGAGSGTSPTTWSAASNACPNSQRMTWGWTTTG